MKYLFDVVLLAVLILLAAVTAASETSMIAVNRIKLRRLAMSGSKAAKLILKILETPDRFFGTVLVANNIVDALIASILTAIMIYITGKRGSGILLATAIVTFLIIVSEVAAKTLAAKRSEKLSLALARPFQVLIYILSPLVRVLSVITNFLVSLVAGKAEKTHSFITEEEIKMLIKIGEEEGTLHREKSKMLSKVFDFSNVLVKDVMIPKDQMVAIDIDAGINDILDKVLNSGYSRLPVYKGKPDNIVGMINMKDLLNLSVNKDIIVLQDIIYPAVFIPSSKKVTELLKEFQEGHAHLAVVTDAKNNIEGLVTLEDLLEEIVGEIKDEHDIRKHKRAR